MRKLSVILFLTFTLAQSGFCCSCINRSKELIEEIYEYSDYVFTGTVITGDYWENEILDFWNTRNMGHHVYMRIDSVIKGDIKIDQIVYIFQAMGGCTETFEYNSKKLIFGQEVRKLKVVEDSEKAKNNNPIPAPPPAPPPPPDNYGLDENGTYKTYPDPKKLSFLKAKLKHYTVIDTDMCGSFNSNSEAAKEIISWLKN
jgi:hypothetical protein